MVELNQEMKNEVLGVISGNLMELLFSIFPNQFVHFNHILILLMWIF